MEKMLVIRQEWLFATHGLSFGAKGLLVALIEMAVVSETFETEITIGSVAPHMKSDAERETFAAWLAELRLRRLLRHVGEDKFRIAPGLWKVQPNAIVEGFRRFG